MSDAYKITSKALQDAIALIRDMKGSSLIGLQVAEIRINSVIANLKRAYALLPQEMPKDATDGYSQCYRCEKSFPSRYLANEHERTCLRGEEELQERGELPKNPNQDTSTIEEARDYLFEVWEKTGY